MRHCFERNGKTRQRRHAPQLRSLALKFIPITGTSLASQLSWGLVGRLGQAWKPDREASGAGQSQMTGQAWRCLAMKAGPIFFRLIARSNGAISLRRARKKLELSSRHVTLRTQSGNLLLQGCNRGQIGPHLPVAGTHCDRGARRRAFPSDQWPSGPPSRIRRRGTRAATSRSWDTCATAMPPFLGELIDPDPPHTSTASPPRF